jgi:hypothetical protein
MCAGNLLPTLQPCLPAELGNEAVDEGDLPGKSPVSVSASFDDPECAAHLRMHVSGEQDVSILGLKPLALDALGGKGMELLLKRHSDELLVKARDQLESHGWSVDRRRRR